MIKIQVIYSLLLLTCALLSACQYLPHRQLNKAIDRETASYLAELSKQEADKLNTSQEHYNWNQALQAMYTKNATCRRATFRLEDAKTNEVRYWRRFIPSLSASLNDRVTLDNLAEAFVDPTFRVNSFLSLGNLLSMPKDIYTRKLSTVGAELSEQLTMRQQTIALYRLFEDRRLWELEGDGLELNEKLIGTLENVDPDLARSRQEQHEQRVKSWKEREKAWLANVGNFYSVDAGQITLVANTTPEVKYASDKLDFHDTQRWGKLQLKLLALREIGEDQQLRELYLRYLPTPSLTASAPSLYSNTSSTDFDFGDIALNPGASWRLDTSGSIGQQIQRLKREKPFQDWEKEKRVQGEVRTLLEGRKKLQEAEEKLQEVLLTKEKYIDLIEKGLVDQTSEATLSNLQKLTTNEIGLHAEIIAISASYWLIDETWWTKHQRPWKNAKQE